LPTTRPEQLLISTAFGVSCRSLVAFFQTSTRSQKQTAGSARPSYALFDCRTAARRNTRSKGCGVYGRDDNRGWKRVAMQNRWSDNSTARVSPCIPRTLTRKPAARNYLSYSSFTP